jgi:hypothetical protein
MSVTSILHDLKAESLLGESQILAEIEALKSNFWFLTDGEKMSFGDYHDLLEKRIASVPRVALLPRIQKGEESAYTVELIEALDVVQEKSNHIYNKVISFQTYLADIERRMKEVQGSFEAWYTIAVNEYLGTVELKLPVATIKALASSEFSRLLGGMAADVTATQTSAKVLLTQLDAKKKMARQKFEMGQQQANSSWATNLPESLGITTQPGRLGLLQDDDAEEEDDLNVPYVSHRTPPVAVAENPENPESAPTERDGGGIVKSEPEGIPAGERDEHSIDPCRDATASGEGCPNAGCKCSCHKQDGLGAEAQPIGTVKEILADGCIVVELKADGNPLCVAIEDASLPEKSPAVELGDRTDIGEIASMHHDWTDDEDMAEQLAPIADEAAILEGFNTELGAEFLSSFQTADLARSTTIGADFSMGDDKTVIALVDHGAIVAEKELAPGEDAQDAANQLHRDSMTQASTDAIRRVRKVFSESTATGFVKHGTPQPTQVITPEEVITVFDESEDAGTILDPEEVEHAIEAEAEDAEDVEHAEMASATPPVTVATTAPAPRPLTTMEDELDDLIPTPPPTVVTAPVPVAVAPTTAPAATASKKRKPLSFAWKEEE